MLRVLVSVTDNDVEGKVLKLLEKTSVEVYPDHIEACHWIKSNAEPKKVIIKISRRKDADKIRRAKKKTERFKFVFDWHQFRRVH